MSKETNPTRPVVHYHGGKWKLAKWIISHFPEHDVYVEPFGGGASVLLHKPRSKVEFYNDLDGEVVNVFRTLQRRSEPLIRQLELTPYSREEFRRAYQPGGGMVERARKAIVRSFMGYGGNGFHKRTGFRSTARKSTGPEKAWTNYPDSLRIAVERFKGVVIENCSAIELMNRCDSPGTLHYVDPPYLPSTRDAGSDYRCELTRNDHIELAKVLHSLKGRVVLSGYPDPLYDELFAGWETRTRQARAASCASRTEKIWIKPA